MIRKNIPHSFSQIQTALIAFANDLTMKVNQIHDNIPVYMQQSGDISYVIREKFEETKTEDIILKTPRVVFNLDDIQFQQDQYTQQFNKYLYKFKNPETQEEEVWQASGRRLPINLIITTDFVCPNFIEYLQNFEVLSILVARDNVFTYEWGGLTFQSAWVLQSPSIERPSMDIGSSSRNWSIKTTFDLQVHLLIPDINSFIRWKDTFIDDIRFDINSDDSVNSGGTKDQSFQLNVRKDILEPLLEKPSETLNSSGINPPVYTNPGKIKNTPLFALAVEHSYLEQDFSDVIQYIITYIGGTKDYWITQFQESKVGDMIIIADKLTSKEIQKHIKNLNMLNIRSFII